MYQSDIYFRFENIDLTRSNSKEIVESLKDSIDHYLISFYSHFNINVKVEYLSEVDFFGYESKDKKMKRKCYQILSRSDITNLVYEGYETMSAVKSYPFIHILIKHTDKITPDIQKDIFNYIDKFSLIIRLLYAVTIKIPFLNFHINQINHSKTYGLIPLYDASMIFPQEMKLKTPVNKLSIIDLFFLLDSPIQKELGLLHLHQIFYYFTDYRLTLSIQIMFIERILSIYMRDFEFEGANNRKKVENLLVELSLYEEYYDDLSITYDIRNEFLHGDLVRKENLKNKISDYCHNNAIPDAVDFYSNLRKRMIDLILRLFISSSPLNM